MSRHLECTPQPIRRLPVRTLLLAGAAVLVQCLPSVAALLQYDAIQLAKGQIWRIVTCHLTHWSGEHLFWDVLMFVVLAGLAERRSVSAFWMCIGSSVAAILLVLLFALPDIQTYRGLSGLDSALTGLLGVTILLDGRDKHGTGSHDLVPLIAFAGLGAKMIYEAMTGSAIFVPSATETPLPLVHLAGALCGVIAGFRVRESDRGSAILAS